MAEDAARPSVMLADAYKNRNHPRWLRVQPDPNDPIGGVPKLKFEKFHIVDASFGSHPAPKFLNKFCGGRFRPSEQTAGLAAYGRGVNLYFRYVKALGIAACLLTLLYIPSIMLAAGANGFSTARQNTLLAALAWPTLGNLPSMPTICAEGAERGPGAGSVTLTCPPGNIMRRVEAMFGAPSGSCSCPVARRPAPLCPGTVEEGACTPAGAHCFLAQSRPITLPSGRSFAGDMCCTNVLTAGKPNFTDIDPRPVLTCTGDPTTVARIATGLCWGRTSCTIPVSATRPISYVPPAGVVCNASAVTGVCVERFGDGASLSQCSSTPGFSATVGHRLIVTARCESENLQLIYGPMPRQRVSWIVSALVFLGICILAGTIYYIRQGELIEGKRARMKAGYSIGRPSAADYTIMFENLPSHANLVGLEKELRSHLTDVLTYECPAIAERLPDGVKIIDVNFALLEANMLTLFKQRGQLLDQLERAARARVLAQRSGSEAQVGRCTLAIKRILETLQQTDDSIDYEEARISDPHRLFAFNKEKVHIGPVLAGPTGLPTIGQGKEEGVTQPIDSREDRRGLKRRSKIASVAFVTFETEEGALRAIALFGGGPLAWICQRRAIRIRDGQHYIKAKRAPEPSDILWTNIGLPRRERRARKCISLCSVFLCILIALMCHFALEDRRRNLSRLYPDRPCDLLLTSLRNGTGASASINGEPAPFTELEVVRDIYWRQFNLTSGNTGILGCFCRDLWSSTGASSLLGFVFKVPEDTPVNTPGAPVRPLVLPPPLTDEATLCSGWLVNYLQFLVSTYGSGLLTMTLSLLLRGAVAVLVKFERHPTRSSEQHARGVLYFILYVLNTSGLLLLLNAYMAANWDVLRGGSYSDFSPGWYLTVAVPLTLTLVLNVPVLNLPLFIEAIATWCRRRCDTNCSSDKTRTKSKTQAELNYKSLGPEFLLEERFAQASACIFSCLAYAGGMPVLVPIMLFTLAAQYWIDKCMFFQCMRTPAKTGAGLARTFSGLLPLACVIHAAFSAWMLTSEDIFSQNTLQDAAESAAGFAVPLGPVEPIDGMGAMNAATVTARALTPHIIPITLAAAGMWVMLMITTAQCCYERWGQIIACPGCSLPCFAPSMLYKGQPPYILAVPPDEAEAVIARLKLTKPHLRRKLAHAMRVHGNEETRSRLEDLTQSYRVAVDALVTTQAEVARATTDLLELEAQRDALYDAGVQPPMQRTASQVQKEEAEEEGDDEEDSESDDSEEESEEDEKPQPGRAVGTGKLHSGRDEHDSEEEHSVEEWRDDEDPGPTQHRGRKGKAGGPTLVIPSANVTPTSTFAHAGGSTRAPTIVVRGAADTPAHASSSDDSSSRDSESGSDSSSSRSSSGRSGSGSSTSSSGSSSSSGSASGSGSEGCDTGTPAPNTARSIVSTSGMRLPMFKAVSASELNRAGSREEEEEGSEPSASPMAAGQRGHAVPGVQQGSPGSEPTASGPDDGFDTPRSHQSFGYTLSNPPPQSYRDFVDTYGGTPPTTPGSPRGRRPEADKWTHDTSRVPPAVMAEPPKIPPLRLVKELSKRVAIAREQEAVPSSNQDASSRQLTGAGGANAGAMARGASSREMASKAMSRGASMRDPAPSTALPRGASMRDPAPSTALPRGASMRAPSNNALVPSHSEDGGAQATGNALIRGMSVKQIVVPAAAQKSLGRAPSFLAGVKDSLSTIRNKEILVRVESKRGAGVGAGLDRLDEGDELAGVDEGDESEDRGQEESVKRKKHVRRNDSDEDSRSTEVVEVENEGYKDMDADIEVPPPIAAGSQGQLIAHRPAGMLGRNTDVLNRPSGDVEYGKGMRKFQSRYGSTALVMDAEQIQDPHGKRASMAQSTVSYLSAGFGRRGSVGISSRNQRGARIDVGFASPGGASVASAGSGSVLTIGTVAMEERLQEQRERLGHVLGAILSAKYNLATLEGSLALRERRAENARRALTRFLAETAAKRRIRASTIPIPAQAATVAYNFEYVADRSDRVPTVVALEVAPASPSRVRRDSEEKDPRLAISRPGDEAETALSEEEEEDAVDENELEREPEFMDTPWTYDINEDRDVAALIGLEAGVDARFKRRFMAGITMEALVTRLLKHRSDRQGAGKHDGEFSPEERALETHVAEAGLELNRPSLLMDEV